MRHLENFVTIKTITRRRPGGSARYVPKAPSGRIETSYRDALAEANSAFFAGEYTAALELYQELRQLILTQSHPELPRTGSWWFGKKFDFAAVDPDRVFMLSRLHMVAADAGEIIEAKAVLDAIIKPGQFETPPAIREFQAIGIDRKMLSVGDKSAADLRAESRDPALAARPELVLELLSDASKAAMRDGDTALAAEIANESALRLLATDAADDEVIEEARTLFDSAESLFSRAGDTEAVKAVRENKAALTNLRRAPATPEPGRIAPGIARGRRPIALHPRVRERIAMPAARRAAGDLSAFRVIDFGRTLDPGRFLAPEADDEAPATVGLLVADGVKTIKLDARSYTTALRTEIYEARVNATTLDQLGFRERVETNFVAYIPHLYFYVLPVAIGDTLAKLGRFEEAVDSYADAVRYPYINHSIEGRDLWLRNARATVSWGDTLFRAERTQAAKAVYERLILLDLTIPSGPLYSPGPFQQMRGVVGEVVKKLRGESFAAHNPQVYAQVARARMQLNKIANNITYLGVGRDDVPVHRFTYLQSVATYLADIAIQAERSYISFKSTAERETIERMQMEASVEIHKISVQAEKRKLSDVLLEQAAARETRELAETRLNNAEAALDEWRTKGWELTTVNAALAWASNAANDQDIRYTGVRYRGETHNFDTDVEDFYDVVGEWREVLNYELQESRLARAVTDAREELDIARVREIQAGVRVDTQELQVDMAEARLEAAEEVLDFALDREFNEEMWDKLADQMRDIARGYLDDAIYAALLMERAYDLEFDRDLNRIRQSYGVPQVDGLLGGDLLKRDIDSFTVDYLKHAQKNNPLREVISLRGEFPAQFATFLRTGILPFTTPLELFDRRVPGAYRRKIKRIEIFVEGLLPEEGAHGTLRHHGISIEWRLQSGGWHRSVRLSPPERMLLSSHQLRRDLAIFQPSEKTLALFENLGPHGNWTLELNRSSNNIDYQAISDIKMVMYFDADYSADLRAHQATFYSDEGGGSMNLSCRFHFPDQYFRLDGDRQVTFAIHPARLAYNHEDHRLGRFAVALLDKTGAGLAGREITVTRASDSTSVTATTDATGRVLSAPATMAPFGDWRGDSPVDDFTVAFAEGEDTSDIGDVQLTLDYRFTWRTDGSL